MVPSPEQQPAVAVPIQPASHRQSKNAELPTVAPTPCTARDPTLGIVHIDLEGRIQYANPAAMHIWGTRDYRGLTLNDVFPDTAAQTILDQHLEERRAGRISNYEITARRLDDKHELPLEITGLPLRDATGSVVGAVGVFRSLELRELSDKVHRLNRETADSSELLHAIAAALGKVLPIDRMSVSRFSTDGVHLNSFFIYGQHGNRVHQKRWWPLTEFQRAWFDDEANRLIGDVDALMQQDPWKQHYHEPAVQEMLAAGIKSSLRKDVYRGNARVGMLALMSNRPHAFTEQHRDLIDALPVEAAVIQALHFIEHSRLKTRLALATALNRCMTVESACRTLAEGLVQTFGWAHVSIFRVDRAVGRVRMISQHWDKRTNIKLPDNYDQPLAKGLLGRVINDRKTQNISNVKDDGDYIPGVESAEVKSELCVPIFDADHREVRWIINVEDLQESAFASDECEELEDLAREVSGVLQRISQLYFLTECFDKASEAIIVTDAHLRITKANRSAAQMLAFDEARKVTGCLLDYVADEDAAARLGEGCANAGEFSLWRKGEAGGALDASTSAVPVHLAGEQMKGPGGWIFIARDMRALRRKVELDLLEKAAYEVAVETSSPLALAMAELQRLAARSDPSHRDSLATVLRRLGRVKDGYTKLALYNASARPKDARRYPIDLGAELECVKAGFTQTEQSLLEIDVQRPLPMIIGDHFQVFVMIEALLAGLIRCAPEDERVLAVVMPQADGVRIRLSGRVPTDAMVQREVARSHGETRLTYQLITDFMQNHEGSFEVKDEAAGSLQFDLVFPVGTGAGS